MNSRGADALTYLETELLAPQVIGPDRLRLAPTALVPELRLLLAEDPIVWWARMEADAKTALTPPFWATAWPGGQALARYLLDHPTTVAGKRILDLASGSGLAAIAAALAGATAVTANDIDPYALAAITLNARVNHVAVTTCHGDLLDGDGGDAEVVLAGDAFYQEALAHRMWPFLQRATVRGACVLIGDPGRQYLPQDELRTLASYPAPATGTSTEPQISEITVLQPRRL
ncbi:50S ribosomal protein L11 methyltransferase [Dactylosporangium sp. NPDC051484]|uniref:class I SAM-dependent methyltransferase n=1 Tax=Dactylosporangium sp. NPDC051484 TaxID=3154942 RepID=UPI00344E2085